MQDKKIWPERLELKTEYQSDNSTINQTEIKDTTA